MDFESLLARLRTLSEKLTRGQLITLAATFLGVVGLIAGAASWLSTPTYSLLFADMDAESASQVLAKLDAEKVPYRLDDGGRTVRVPQQTVDRLKIELAATVTSGRIGFEIFDRTAFGQTEFLEQINYRRALEGELARTISSISEVASARVHIAMAKESLFSSRQQPAKASVILKLKSNRPLAAQSVAGITNLVAASVEGLRADAVVVIDSYGRPLAQPRDAAAEPLGAEQLERQQQLERDLTNRVVALLEPVVGVGHVRVNVSARLNNDLQEQTEEIYDPNGVVRSRQVSSEGGPGAAPAQGLAGSRGNLPAPVGANEDPATASTSSPPTAQSTGVALRSSETTNFEISKVTRVTQKPRGQIARLSVAVLLDHEAVSTKAADGTTTRTMKPREQGDLQKIQELVAAGVGLDTTRGDQLTVENIAFNESPELDEPVGFMQRYGPLMTEGGRILAVLVLGLLAFFVLVRPVVRQTILALVPPSGSPGAIAGLGSEDLPRTVADLEGEIEAQLDAAAAAAADPRMGVLTRRVQKLVQENPENAAKLVRSWLVDEAPKRR